ncbi:MAG TPA: hypothetical protein DCE56_12115 [Cyanobacteria bacterium UBA8553]|nr:hypothetical protein [Cyanobacteria bacterium UBA8553]
MKQNLLYVPYSEKNSIKCLLYLYTQKILPKQGFFLKIHTLSSLGSGVTGSNSSRFPWSNCSVAVETPYLDVSTDSHLTPEKSEIIG